MTMDHDRTAPNYPEDPLQQVQPEVEACSSVGVAAAASVQNDKANRTTHVESPPDFAQRAGQGAAEVAPAPQLPVARTPEDVAVVTPNLESAAALAQANVSKSESKSPAAPTPTTPKAAAGTTTADGVDTSEFTFHCEVEGCGRSFKRACSLARHMCSHGHRSSKAAEKTVCRCVCVSS